MNEVSICNEALSRAKIPYKIQALTEGSAEADACSFKYSFSRDKVLESFLWNFAKTSRTLALLSDTYPEWYYAYGYPSDCHRAFYLYDENYAVPPVYFNAVTGRYDVKGSIEFEVRANTNLSRRVICCNKEDAVLIYVGKVTDANMFSNGFIDALAWRLASDLSMELKGDTEHAKVCLQLYYSELAKAAASNMNEGNELSKPYNKYYDARQ